MLVGYSRAAEGYISRILDNPQWGYVIAGVLDDFVPIGTGSIDWKSVRKVIDEISYDGFVTLESGGYSSEQHAKIFQNFFQGKDILEGV